MDVSFLSSFAVFSCSVGASAAAKRMVSLSSHSWWLTARGDSVSGHGSPPKALMSQSCGFFLSSSSSDFASSPEAAALLLGIGRADRKAICLPSGDHLGSVQLSLPRVNAISSFDVKLERIRLATISPLSLSGTLLTHAAQRQSGEI